jgi:hypothetical protein
VSQNLVAEEDRNRNPERKAGKVDCLFNHNQRQAWDVVGLRALGFWKGVHLDAFHTERRVLHVVVTFLWKDSFSSHFAVILTQRADRTNKRSKHASPTTSNPKP